MAQAHLQFPPSEFPSRALHMVVPFPLGPTAPRLAFVALITVAMCYLFVAGVINVSPKSQLMWVGANVCK